MLLLLFVIRVAKATSKLLKVLYVSIKLRIIEIALRKNLFLIFLLALDVGVYKCVGHQYSINEKEIVNTLYIVIPVHSLTTVINVGDIMVGNHSNGFLETVNEVRQDQGRTFIHTELTRCSGNIRIRFAF